MAKKAYNEIRLDEEGLEDDICIDNVDVHLERMDNNFWWLGLYGKDGKRTTFHLIPTQNGFEAKLIENDLNTKIIKWRKPKWQK